MTKRIAVLFAVGVFLAAGCSEPAPEPAAPSVEAAEAAAATDDDDAVEAVEEEAVEEEAVEEEASHDTTGSGDTTDAAEEGTTSTGAVDTSDLPPAIDGLGGKSWFLGEIPSAPVAADPDAAPIRIGMINQENTPFGSFPTVRAAVQVAVKLINTELGGVDGRPVELHVCLTNFDAQQSQACAQELVESGVVALVGGVDVTSNGSLPVIEQNALALVGGIPASLIEQRSPNAFFFSGGGAGTAAAFLSHAADNGAERVLLAYGEFDAFEVSARDYAAVVGTSLGLEVDLVPVSLFATDYLPVITKARDSGADAVIVLAADSACLPVMAAARDLELDAQLYLTGACASETLIDAAEDSILGVLFNAEGPLEPGDPEGELYAAAVERYATEPAGGAGTAGFRGMMNLYALLAGIPASDLDARAVLEAARATTSQPSFWGHPYQCDGRQVPGLPALCAPQQVLFEVPEVGGIPTGVGGWIDTAALFSVVDGE